MPAPAALDKPAGRPARGMTARRPRFTLPPPTSIRKLPMSVLSEFKAFAVKGNVVDMAVGIIIGAAFGKIVSSFVGDVIMPPIGLLIGGVDFTDLAITLKAAEGTAPAVMLSYGKFIH